MIETKQYKNSNSISITSSAKVGHVDYDTYTVSFKINISNILTELNRIGANKHNTFLTIKSNIYSNGATITPYASYGSIGVPVCVYDSEETFVEFDLTNAVSAYVSGDFVINFGVNITGTGTSVEALSPYTSYIEFLTENAAGVNSNPLIFFRKKDIAHSSVKGKFINLPLIFGGESIIDLFNLNVKHIVPLFDMSVGTLNYPFTLIYNKLDRNTNSYVKSNLPYGWKTSLDMKVEKSSTFYSLRGDKTVYFYDSINQSHKLDAIWYFYLNNTKTYIDDLTDLFLNDDPGHEGEVWVHYNGYNNYQAFVEIISDDGYRFFSDDIPTEDSIKTIYGLSSHEQDEHIFDSSMNKIAFDDQGKFSYIESVDKDFRIVFETGFIYLRKRSGNYYVDCSTIYLQSLNSIKYEINENITNTYTYSIVDSNISSITFDISESESKTVNFDYSSYNLTEISNSLTEENRFVYGNSGYLWSFNYRNKIDEMGDSLSQTSLYNIPVSSYIYRYGNKVTVFEFNSNTEYNYIFNPDSSILKVNTLDLDTNKTYIEEIPNEDKYTKASLSLEASDSYVLCTKNISSSNNYEITYHNGQGAGIINTESVLKLEPLILEIDLSGLSMSDLMCNSLAVTITPYKNNAYDTENQFRSYITNLFKEKYYIPFFYRDGDEKISVVNNYSRWFSAPNVGQIKIYKGNAFYTKLNSSFCPIKIYKNDSLSLCDYTGFNMLEHKTTYDNYFNETVETFTYDVNQNLISSHDNYDNQVLFTYNSGRKLVKTTHKKLNENDKSFTKYTYDSLTGKRKEISRMKDINNNYPVESYDYIDNTSFVKEYTNYKGVSTSYDRDTKSFNITSKYLTLESPLDRTKYTYKNNELIKLSSYGNNNQFEYSYDYLFRKKRITLPNNNYYLFSYDDNFYDSSLGIVNGTKLTITKPNNTTKDLYFDKENKIVKETINSTKYNKYIYDSKGRETSRKLYSGNTILQSFDHVYDSKNRLKNIYNSFNGVIDQSKQYNYSEYGLISSIDRNIIKNYQSEYHNESYTYDYKQRLSTVNSQNKLYSLYTYDNLNNISIIAYNNSSNFNSSKLKKEYTYLKDINGNETNTLSLVSKLNNNVNDDSFSSCEHEYEYDLLGNIVKERIKKGYIEIILTTNKEYVYDNLNRLIKEIYYCEDGNNKYITYTYDSRGNITTKSTYSFTGLNPINGTLKKHSSYSYKNTGWKDELLSVHNYSDYPTLNTLIDSYSFTYDSLGRPNKHKSYSITYNTENKITNLVYENETYSYTYDINGIRRTKSDGTNTTTFYYDDEGLLIKEERSNYPHIIYHYNSSDIIGFSIKASLNSEYIDYIYSKNIQNDIIRIYKLSDMSIVAEYDYDAFGNHTVSNWTNDNIGDINPFRYRSYYYDAETNLYYLKSRYYSPELMRFLTPDRVSILDDTLDNIDACNLYVYCNNNPVMYVDENGCLPEWVGYLCWGIAATIVVVAGVALMVASGGSVSVALLAALSASCGVASSTTALTVTSFVFVGATIGFVGASMYAAESGSFADSGPAVLATTVTGGIYGAASGFFSYQEQIRTDESWSTIRRKYWNQQGYSKAPKGLDGYPIELNHPYGRYGSKTYIFEEISHTDHVQFHRINGYGKGIGGFNKYYPFNNYWRWLWCL